MTAADAGRVSDTELYDELLAALCLATPPCQDHRDDAVEAALVMGKRIAAERARAVADLRAAVEEFDATVTSYMLGDIGGARISQAQHRLRAVLDATSEQQP